MPSQEFIANVAELMNKFERGYTPNPSNKFELTVYEQWKDFDREEILGNEKVSRKSDELLKQITFDFKKLFNVILEVTSRDEKSVNKLGVVVNLLTDFYAKYYAECFADLRETEAEIDPPKQYIEEAENSYPAVCPSNGGFCEECSVFVENVPEHGAYCKNSGMYLHK